MEHHILDGDMLVRKIEIKFAARLEELPDGCAELFSFEYKLLSFLLFVFLSYANRTIRSRRLYVHLISFSCKETFDMIQYIVWW